MHMRPFVFYFSMENTINLVLALPIKAIIQTYLNTKGVYNLNCIAEMYTQHIQYAGLGSIPIEQFQFRTFENLPIPIRVTLKSFNSKSFQNIQFQFRN